MPNNKKLCPVHHLFYSGNRCPLCDKERLEGYANKFARADMVKHEDKDDRDITESDLDKLMEKFGSSKK